MQKVYTLPMLKCKKCKKCEYVTLLLPKGKKCEHVKSVHSADAQNLATRTGERETLVK